MKLQNPTLSVITPSFNQGHFIKQTIDSVLGQSHAPLEYIVMDGQSQDTTVSILKTYAKRLSWTSEKDRGQTHAINKGLAQCRGDIVCYINSDDYFLPDAFKTVLTFFRSHPDENWVVGDAVIVNETGKEIQGYVRWYKKLIREFLPSFLLYILNPYPQPSVFIKKSALKQIGLFDESLRFTMDYDCWLKLYRQFGAPSILSTSLSAFRIHSTSKGSLSYKKQFSEELSVLERYSANPVVIGLHKLHNQCILWSYALIK